MPKENESKELANAVRALACVIEAAGKDIRSIQLDRIEEKVDHVTESLKNKHEAVVARLDRIEKAVSKPKTISLVWVKTRREPIACIL